MVQYKHKGKVLALNRWESSSWAMDRLNIKGYQVKW